MHLRWLIGHEGILSQQVGWIGDDQERVLLGKEERVGTRSWV